MTVAIVSFPRLDEDDRRWIESIRVAHDPLAGRIEAHFTLVFPAAVDVDDVIAEIADAARATPSIPFVVRRAMARRDAFARGGHVFLVPDEGAPEIVDLHERLYRGGLQAHLRGDIPFIPHLTVAAHDDFGRCEALAQQLSIERRRICGTLESIDIVDVGEGQVESRERFGLGQPLRAVRHV